VQNLEQDIQQKLIERQGRRIVLTYAGQVLRTYARRMFALESEMEGALADLSNIETGEVTPLVFPLTYPDTSGEFYRHTDLSSNNSAPTCASCGVTGETLQERGVDLGENLFDDLFWTLFIGGDLNGEARRIKGGQTPVKSLLNPNESLFGVFLLTLCQTTDERFFSRCQTKMVQVGINSA
jgi:hypothetical protein